MSERERDFEGRSTTVERQPPIVDREPPAMDREPAVEREPVTGTRFLGDEESRALRERWEAIQASFIDEPRESVQRAAELVEDVTDRIVERFEDERDGLEETWEAGEDVDTEDLRVALQRYRGFFDRLLAV